MRIAVHNDDIDGISCAALMLLIYPDADIDFLSVTEAMETEKPYDIVADLPKPKNAKVNIDHHKTNLERLKNEGRLGPKDLIDPEAPSAAGLVAKYFNLDSHVAREIVEMADLADTGHLDGDLYKLDKLIKFYVNDNKTLKRLALILAKKGKKFPEDKEFQVLWENVSKIIQENYEKIEKALNELVKKKAKYALVILSDSIPYILAKDIAHLFLQKNGRAIAVFYRDPTTGKRRVSFRISNKCDIEADNLAERLGGGGHKRAAGAILDNEDSAILTVLEEFSKKDVVAIATIG
ncbi:MAG: DHHA1 domain-containing protein [Candidatus Njordarchaeia archaeon]